MPSTHVSTDFIDWSISMRNNFMKWTVIFAVLVGGAVIFYNKVYIPKATYAYVTAKKGDLKLTVFGIGTVSAKNIYPVGSNSGGKLLKVFKDQGEWVEKGEIVATLDPVDLPDQLAQAEALLKKARYETLAARKELEGLYAQHELAALTFKRYDTLYRKGYAAQAEYDKARTDLTSVEAQIEASKARIASSKAECERAQKSIDALKQKIDRLAIVSPIDGYIISKDAEAAQTIAAQQPVVTIVDTKSIWVKANVDERISGVIEKGQRADIVLRSQDGAPLAGHVARIEAKSDPVTEERIVDVAFDKVPFPFHIDEQAEVSIETGRLHNVVLVPLHLIRRGGVWVYNDGEAHFKKVEILGKNDKEAAVEGLTTNEKILVPDSRKKPLFDGVDIRI